jgi:hypothetical protein
LVILSAAYDDCGDLTDWFGFPTLHPVETGVSVRRMRKTFGFSRRVRGIFRKSDAMRFRSVKKRSNSAVPFEALWLPVPDHARFRQNVWVPGTTIRVPKNG